MAEFQLKKTNGVSKISSSSSKGSKDGFTRKCASLIKEQRARIYILRRCATMLCCWLENCPGGMPIWNNAIVTEHSCKVSCSRIFQNRSIDGKPCYLGAVFDPLPASRLAKGPTRPGPTRPGTLLQQTKVYYNGKQRVMWRFHLLPCKKLWLFHIYVNKFSLPRVRIRRI
ncbi:hypothetical protein OROGR_005146 [Orobanche gracilis]